MIEGSRTMRNQPYPSASVRKGYNWLELDCLQAEVR